MELLGWKSFFLPTLLGMEQPAHEFLYWEFHERGGKQAILADPWKAVRLGVGQDPDGPLERRVAESGSDGPDGEQRDARPDRPDLCFIGKQ